MMSHIMIKDWCFQAKINDISKYCQTECQNYDKKNLTSCISQFLDFPQDIRTFPEVCRYRSCWGK